MTLDFNDAMDASEFLEWMGTHAPGLIPEVKPEIDKNLTVGDVHVASAGGDKKPKRKKPEPPVSVAYTPEKGFEDLTFDEAGSSDQAFDYFIRQVQMPVVKVPVDIINRAIKGDADAEAEINKLKIKHKTSIDAEPAELKALMDALNTNPAIRAVLQSALAMGKSTRTILLARHGATALNNDSDTSVDRIRGWSNVPLSREGKEEAAKLAEKVASKDPPDHIVTSDLERAHDTAKMIAAACDMKIDDVSKGFRPWDVGEYAGKSSKDAVPILCRYAIETPDKKTPGGESFNTFRARFFNALSDAIKKYPGSLMVVTHHRGERLIKSWAEAGYPADGSIDAKEFTKKGEATAGYEDIDIPVDRLNAAANANVTKWVGTPIDYDNVFEDEVWDKWTPTAESTQKDFTLNVCKVDAEKQIFYGWAYVSEENGKVIIDKQDDYILPEDLVQAAEDFTLHGGKLGDMHDERNVGRVVASFVTSADLCKAFDMSVGNNRRGWILGFKVDDPEVWKKIKSGTQLELSIAGRGVRMEEE